MDSEEKGGFRKLTLVIAIFAVTDGTDGEDNVDVGATGTQQVDDAHQVVGTFVDGEQFLLKQRGRALLTVVNNIARLLQAVHVVGAEGDEDDSGEPPPIPLQLEGEPPFNSMQHGGRIVHRAIGIDRGAELILHEPLTNTVCETAAHEEHLFARLNLEAWLGYVNDGSKFHWAFYRYSVNGIMLTARNLQSRLRQRHVDEAGIGIATMLVEDGLDAGSRLGVFGYHIEIASTACAWQLVA